VIVRISASAVPESSLNDYLAHVERNEIPHYEGASGLVSVWLLERRFVAYVEVMTISLWRSEEALNEFVEKRRVDLASSGDRGIQLEPWIYQLVMSRGSTLRDSDC